MGLCEDALNVIISDRTSDDAIDIPDHILENAAQSVFIDDLAKFPLVKSDAFDTRPHFEENPFICRSYETRYCSECCLKNKRILSLRQRGSNLFHFCSVIASKIN